MRWTLFLCVTGFTVCMNYGMHNHSFSMIFPSHILSSIIAYACAADFPTHDLSVKKNTIFAMAQRKKIRKTIHSLKSTAKPFYVCMHENESLNRCIINQWIGSEVVDFPADGAFLLRTKSAFNYALRTVPLDLALRLSHMLRTKNKKRLHSMLPLCDTGLFLQEFHPGLACSLLGDAVRSNFYKGFQALVAKGFDIHGIGEDEEPLIFLASSLGRVRMVDFLLSNGTNVNQHNRAGSSLLTYIILCPRIPTKKREQLVSLLLKYPAIDLTKRDTQGNTVLSTMHTAGSSRKIKQLITQAFVKEVQTGCHE